MSREPRPPELLADEPAAGREGGKERRPALAEEFELRLLRQLWQLRGQFKDSRDAVKVPRAALRSGMELLAAPEGCVALLPPQGEEAQVLFAFPKESRWDATLLTAFLRGQ